MTLLEVYESGMTFLASQTLDLDRAQAIVQLQRRHHVRMGRWDGHLKKATNIGFPTGCVRGAARGAQAAQERGTAAGFWHLCLR